MRIQDARAVVPHSKALPLRCRVPSARPRVWIFTSCSLLMQSHESSTSLKIPIRLEPSVQLPVHMISSHAPSALGHLSRFGACVASPHEPSTCSA